MLRKINPGRFLNKLWKTEWRRSDITGETLAFYIYELTARNQ